MEKLRHRIVENKCKTMSSFGFYHLQLNNLFSDILHFQRNPKKDIPDFYHFTQFDRTNKLKHSTFSKTRRNKWKLDIVREKERHRGDGKS